MISFLFFYFSDPELHLRREELDDRVPGSYRLLGALHEQEKALKVKRLMINSKVKDNLNL
jgi:hypothetical protein